MKETIMLEVKDLTVRYGAIEALSNVSVSAQNGFITAILGANGAGKSSLLRAISGISPVVGGTIMLDGKDITRDQALHKPWKGVDFFGN
jgi:branched-chain amino acid transport system ATP-binding protein